MIKRKKSMMISNKKLKKMLLLNLLKESSLKKMLTFQNLILKISIKGLMRSQTLQLIFQTRSMMILIMISISQFLKEQSNKNDYKPIKFEFKNQIYNNINMLNM